MSKGEGYKRCLELGDDFIDKKTAKRHNVNLLPSSSDESDNEGRMVS